MIRISTRQVLRSSALLLGLLGAESGFSANCNPAHLHQCAYPFPSDYYAVKDANSPTGKRLQVDDDIISPAIMNQYSASLKPSAIFNGSSGYSAASPVLFEWNSQWDAESAKTAVIAYDLTTGEAEEVRVDLSLPANSKRISAENKKPVMEIRPRTRWKFGHRYVVVTTNALKDAEGAAMPAIPNFQTILQQKAAPFALYENALSFLNQQGISEDKLLIATVFTVRDEQEVTQPLLTQVNTVYQQSHPVRNLRVEYPSATVVGANVYGEVRLSSFRDAEGYVRIAEGDEGDEYWTTFILSIPRSAAQTKAPVAIYGHGISINKESAIGTVTIANATHGVATFAIDQPNHGDRQDQDGGYIFNLVHPKDVIRLLGIITQSPVDHVSAQRAIETSLAKIDTYPEPDLASVFPWAVFHGDGKPDLDVSKIYYQGTSMGGVLGLAFLSVTPGPLQGSYLQVPGIGVTDILSKSILYEAELFRPLLPGFEDVFPRGISGDEAALLFAGVQHKLDYGDAANFVHHLRDPFPDRKPVPVTLQYGMRDGIVPNATTEALLLLADIPLLKPVLQPVPGVRTVNKLENGYGALQVEPVSGNADLNGHISFFRAEAVQQLEAWLESVVWKR